MAPTTRLFYFLLVTLLCLAHSARGVGDDVSSRIDSDLFLEDEAGSGHGSGPDDDIELNGSGNGEDDEDYKKTKSPAKPTPRAEDPYRGIPPGGMDGGDLGIKEGTDDPVHGVHNEDIFNQKNESQASFFSQPGILAAIICGAIVGLLCAILLVMFIVYRMRKKDEGSYVLDDSKRTPTAYGKTKEFFA